MSDTTLHDLYLGVKKWEEKESFRRMMRTLNKMIVEKWERDKERDPFGYHPYPFLQKESKDDE